MADPPRAEFFYILTDFLVSWQFFIAILAIYNTSIANFLTFVNRDLFAHRVTHIAYRLFKSLCDFNNLQYAMRDMRFAILICVLRHLQLFFSDFPHFIPDFGFGFASRIDDNIIVLLVIDIDIVVFFVA